MNLANQLKHVLVLLGLLLYLPMASHAAQCGWVYCFEQNGQIQVECSIETPQHHDQENVSHAAGFGMETGQDHKDIAIFLQGLSLTPASLEIHHLAQYAGFSHPVSHLPVTEQKNHFSLYKAYSPFHQAYRTIVLLN